MDCAHSSIKDVIDQFDHVDDPDVLERAKTNTALHHALMMSRPEELARQRFDARAILPVANGERYTRRLGTTYSRAAGISLPLHRLSDSKSCSPTSPMSWLSAMIS